APLFGLKIDQSKTFVSSPKNNPNTVGASVPLTNGDGIRVTSDQLKAGDVDVAFQCVQSRTEQNGCNKVRLTGYDRVKKQPTFSLIDQKGNVVQPSRMIIIFFCSPCCVSILMVTIMDVGTLSL
ncbi:unnamed protein product, partial [Didymodactylos carnosus]